MSRYTNYPMVIRTSAAAGPIAMSPASIELPQEFSELIEEQIADYDQFDTVNEFVAQATAEKLQQEAKEEHRKQGTYTDGPITEEERELHRRLVDLGVVERDPVLLDEV